MLLNFFIPLLQSFLQPGLLVLNSLKLFLEARHLGFFLLKGVIMRVILAPHLILELLVRAPQFLVVQEQTSEHLGPSIGALLKKEEVLVLL